METVTTTTPPSVGAYRFIDDRATGYGLNQSGDMDRQIARWVESVQTRGHAITETGHRPDNHFVSGIGGGHQDDHFAAVGQSHAAWTENDSLLWDVRFYAAAAERTAEAAAQSGTYSLRQHALLLALVAAFARARAELWEA